MGYFAAEFPIIPACPKRRHAKLLAVRPRHAESFPSALALQKNTSAASFKKP
jgi:hypothetical protein